MPMRRRQLLAAGVGLGLAGCVSAPRGDEEEAGASTVEQATPSRPVPADVDLPVPRSEMYPALPRDRIPAIVEPAFGPDWDRVEVDGEPVSLPEDAPVVGVVREGVARAYPLRILNWHEVVNDQHGGPLLVSYCVQCGSAVVAERVIAGEPTAFGVSGLLWRADLVMYDRATESLWSQIMATAIDGPRTGDQLTLLPSTMTSWGAWKGEHPDTEVLLPPPHSNTLRGRDATRDYATPKYSYGDEDQLIGLDSHDGELHPNTLVVGVSNDGEAKAYPFPAVREDDVVNDEVGGKPVVVTVTTTGTLVAYDRRVAGVVPTFRAHDPEHLRAGGSRWCRESGRAVDGPHEGRRLSPASPVPAMFWLGWSGFHPETDVYGLDDPRTPEDP